LSVHDIYQLQLDAELVVLSGCSTALGKKVRGEGLLGLARSFLYAGASRVVASLWMVRDRATAELMAAFYRSYLEQDMTPAAALRAAQVSMLHQARWRDPYFWAAFGLYGDWGGQGRS
jgi:CHAT domain-containing protein